MKLHHIAEALDLELHGDGAAEIVALAPLGSAAPGQISFAVATRYRTSLLATRASACIVPRALLPDAPCNALVSDNPYLSYAQLSWILIPEHRPGAGIHATAVVDPGVRVPASVSIGAGAIIGADVELGEGCVVGEQCLLGARVALGPGTRLFPRSTILDDCTLGHECRVQSGAVIGSEGFGYAPAGERWQVIHQTGAVVLGDRVHVGANTTIDRGAIEHTLIGNDVILDNQIQIAHNVQIGCGTAVAGCAGIAGSTVIGAHCLIGGACNIVGHLRIADHVHLSAASLVTQSIETAGRYGSGMPLQTTSRWRRTYAALGRLDELVKRVRRLEKQAAAESTPANTGSMS